MSRLYEAKVDGKRWKIVETDNKSYHTFKLFDTEKGETYILRNIIGVEQVAEDEFLVYRRVGGDLFEIGRYKVKNAKFHQVFSKRFSKFDFISDDRIMFSSWGNTGPYCCIGIYSIKENKILDEAKWLNGAAVEIYEDSDNPSKVKIYVEKKLISYKLDNPTLSFVVDPDTLQPSSDCYSELRDSYIKVSSKDDIESIKAEDEKYIFIIKEYMYQKERERLQKVKAKLLLRKSE